MHAPNRDLQLLRHMIDLIERERQHNADQDCRIEAIEKTCNTLNQWFQQQQHQFQQYQGRVENLETQLPKCQEQIENLQAKLPDLERVIRSQADVIYEQGCMVNPHSNDGRSIADSYYSNRIGD